MFHLPWLKLYFLENIKTIVESTDDEKGPCGWSACCGINLVFRIKSAVTWLKNENVSDESSALWTVSERVFKEGINPASYTFACFLAPKPDLWTVSEEPPGTMSSLHHIWLMFQWSKPMCHYESNVDENMFNTVNQKAGRVAASGGGGRHRGS